MTQLNDNFSPVVTVENLCKVYARDSETKKKALLMADKGVSRKEIKEKTGALLGVYNASFEVNPGEIFVIMGLSGSGKSTLLRCVNRLIQPDSGSILVNCNGQSVDVTKCSAHQMRLIRRDVISMVFQSFAVFPNRSVIKNVEFGLENQGVKKHERIKKAMESLELVGLDDWADQYPDELSGGMKQRIGLARALATGANLLLMDEPFSALDPLIRIYLQKEFLDIQQKLKCSSIFVTHDLKEALKVGQRIAIMQDGVFVQVGNPEEILINPKTEYVRDFVEHADPTPVVSIKRIVNKLGEFSQSDGISDNSGTMIINHNLGRFKINSDKKNRTTCALEDKELIIVDHQHEDEIAKYDSKEIILKIDDNTPMAYAIKARAKSHYPLLVYSDGAPTGLLRSKDLLIGFLNKGRKEDSTEVSTQM
jgi:glycine betaine/proline transport system ATP-binding protein